MEKLVTYIKQNYNTHIEDLKVFLKYPSISTTTESQKDVRACATFLVEKLKAIGMEHVEAYETPGHPVVYADWLHAEGKPTVLIYGHYDVQPVDPVDLWQSPPFDADIRDGYVYARGASDDKGQVLCHIESIAAHLKVNGRLPVNVKFMIEGEEEIGSPSLKPFILENKPLLQADLALISDTPMFSKGVPSICYSLRGLAYLEVMVRGPKSDLHSGQYGGPAPNPINALAYMISRLKDPDGRIQIPGFYDDVVEITAEQRASMKELPHDDSVFKAEIGVTALTGEEGYSTLEQLWIRPTLDCNGIIGGFTGDGAKTVIPSVAKAKISMRLVANQSPAKVAAQFEAYLQSIIPPGVTVEVSELHGGDPVMIATDGPGVRAAIRAIEKASGKRPVLTGEGGSIPIVADIGAILGIQTVLLGFNLPDDNLHAPNERFGLENFEYGILTSAHFFNELSIQV